MPQPSQLVVRPQAARPRPAAVPLALRVLRLRDRLLLLLAALAPGLLLLPRALGVVVLVLVRPVVLVADEGVDGAALPGHPHDVPPDDADGLGRAGVLDGQAVGVKVLVKVTEPPAAATATTKTVHAYNTHGCGFGAGDFYRRVGRIVMMGRA